MSKGRFREAIRDILSTAFRPQLESPITLWVGLQEKPIPYMLCPIAPDECDLVASPTVELIERIA